MYHEIICALTLDKKIFSYMWTGGTTQLETSDRLKKPGLIKSEAFCLKVEKNFFFL